MLKLIVASDSHGSPYVERFAMLASKYDSVVFLGDELDDASQIEHILNAPIMKVAGNCDYFSKETKEIVIELEGVRLLITHGDKYNVKMGLNRLHYRAMEAEASVVLYGHTHKPYCSHEGETLFLNPGALKNGCYAEVTLANGKIVPRLLQL